MEQLFHRSKLKRVEYSQDRNFLVRYMEKQKPWATKEIIINYAVIRNDSF